MRTLIYPIQKIENRELELKDFNVDCDFWLFNLKIKQAIEINIELTYGEIKKLIEMAETLRKQHLEL